jgi:hypothetical protein
MTLPDMLIVATAALLMTAFPSALVFMAWFTRPPVQRARRTVRAKQSKTFAHTTFQSQR